MLDLLAAGKIQQRGFIRQEDVPLQLFLENRFGKVYARPVQTLLQAQLGGAER
jgi:saccharopine dehydrogenase-like NADP-dependent oxidoreductase